MIDERGLARTRIAQHEHPVVAVHYGLSGHAPHFFATGHVQQVGLTRLPLQGGGVQRRIDLGQGHGRLARRGTVLGVNGSQLQRLAQPFEVGQVGLFQVTLRWRPGWSLVDDGLLVAPHKVAAFDPHVTGNESTAAGINGPGHDACLGLQFFELFLLLFTHPVGAIALDQFIAYGCLDLVL